MDSIQLRLYEAAIEGSMQKLSSALEEGALINKPDATGKTALIHASGNGHRDIVEKLLQEGADVEPVEHEIRATALIAGTIAGNVEIVRLLLEQKSPVNHQSEDGFSALHFAATKGLFPIVSLLLSHNAEVDLVNTYGETALHRASAGGFGQIVEILLEHKAAIDLITTQDGLTPLMIAADRGQTEVVRILLDHGADKNKSSFGLRKAVDYARLKAFNDIESLLAADGDNKSGIDISTITIPGEKNEKATKALCDALWQNNMRNMIEAIEAGADLDGGKGMFPPLSIAAGNGNLEAVRLLVELGADIDKKDSAGLPALAKACGACHSLIVEYLLDHGATVTNDVLIAASIHKHPTIMKLLHKGQLMMGSPRIDEEDSNLADLFQAVLANDRDTVLTFLEKGMEVDARDLDGATLLYWASRKGLTDMVTLLLEKEADPDAETGTRWTPIMEACLVGHFKIVTLLVENGADVNHGTAVGATALIFAVAESHPDIVKYLLKQGAEKDREITDGPNQGMTALKFAEKTGDEEIIGLLKE